MKFVSIRSRLVFWIGLMVTLILALGSYVIFVTARSTLYQEIDQNLESTLALQQLELELVDGSIYHEWLHDIENDTARIGSTYIQVWNEVTGEATRSPALQGTDLPHFFGSESAQYTNVLLPGGHHGRVIGRQVFPVVEWDGQDEEVARSEATKAQPHYMAIALDVEAAENALRRLIGTLLLGLAFSLFVSFVTIRQIIARSIRPLERLERVIMQTDVNDPKAELAVPQDLPAELRGLVARYQELFGRIGRVRERERKFSANVAHELRTPLAGVEATLEQALAEKREAEDYRQRIECAQGIVRQMGDLIHRLMWFSRLNNKSEAVERGPVDISLVVETRLAILQERIASRGLVLETEIPAQSCVVASDETLVGILMNNLIGNAVAHSDTGSVVKVLVQSVDAGICVVISNVCRSFERSELAHIFEPFYRSDAARSVEGGHSGIGLALAQEIAKLLHVELDVRFSEASVFSVKIHFSEKNEMFS
ncbi:histidine kinase dimerization/phospho-acceptor domain-containing protein [Coraliomargarita algicola]|uniref:histidine kinase n=1 Tax=Coraliomargarita algicola TaxID=3092156 RepID=A0ABZ0RNA9_9BACT|nr:ATP-binding protein [Coraliomargarita sp. J2-16]WPJ97706.1 histidine kinase dimerization/phospho-acceptor domain-containing protein [Coraliomargarita sp. J2-16]